MRRLDRASIIHGEVLFAEHPNRLSNPLAAGPEQPEAYVTWEVRECGTGAIVRLTVDEDDTTGEEVEAAWQPVVTMFSGVASGSQASRFGFGATRRPMLT
jgi:hypothetical protein